MGLSAHYPQLRVSLNWKRALPRFRQPSNWIGEHWPTFRSSKVYFNKKEGMAR